MWSKGENSFECSDFSCLYMRAESSFNFALESLIEMIWHVSWAPGDEDGEGDWNTTFEVQNVIPGRHMLPAFEFSAARFPHRLASESICVTHVELVVRFQ